MNPASHPNQRRAYLFALSAVALWSTVATAFKLSLAWLTPIQLLLVATASSCAVLAAILLGRGTLHTPFRLLARDPRRYLLLGALNPFLYYLVLFEAYDRLPAQQAQPLNYTWAITLALLSVPLLGHRLRRQDLVAALLGYSGVVVIATGGDVLGLQFDSLSGVVLALLSTVIWALYWIFNTRNPAEPVAGLLAGFLCSLPLVLAAAIWEGQWHYPWQGMAGAVYVGLFEMGITFVLWLLALRNTESTAKVSNLIFLSPFLSLLLISQILGETILPATYLGLVMIVCGVWWQQRAEPAR